MSDRDIKYARHGLASLLEKRRLEIDRLNHQISDRDAEIERIRQSRDDAVATIRRIEAERRGDNTEGLPTHGEMYVRALETISGCVEDLADRDAEIERLTAENERLAGALEDIRILASFNQGLKSRFAKIAAEALGDERSEPMSDLATKQDANYGDYFTVEKLEVVECRACGFRFDVCHYDHGKEENCASCECDQLRAERDKYAEALRVARHVLVKGMEARMMDQWPALDGPLQNAIAKCNEALDE